MSNKLHQYFSFCGRFLLNFLLAFILMRMLYLYFEGSKDGEDDGNSMKNYDGKFSTKDISSKTFTKLVQSKVTSPATSLRQRGVHINAPVTGKFALSHDNSSSIRNDIRRLNVSNKSRRRSGYSYPRPAYYDWENALQTVAIEWDSFVNMPMQPPRTHQAVPFNVLNDLRVCKSKSSKLNSDFVGFQSTASNTSIPVRKGCNDIWADNFISSWKNRMVNGLCEENANSNIRCFDSVTKSRYCIFDNAMMNFRKMRKRKQSDGHIGRSWERGFLAADCGDMAPDDIGYLPLYKPDIEGRESAVCDYVFNETVIMYSHENVRNFGSMITDYLNVWTILWLAGLGRTSRDVSLFHIDSIKRGRYTGDLTNQFFKTYNVSFRRILRAADFADKTPVASSQSRSRQESGPKLCFKRLIVQPRPVLQFQWDGIDDPSCPTAGVSALFQRWNLQIRNNYGLLGNHLSPSLSASGSSNMNSAKEVSNKGSMQVLLITRSLRSSGSDGVQTLPTQLLARIFRNQASLVARLQEYFDVFDATSGGVQVKLVVQDLTLLPYEEQVRLMSKSSLVIGMHGAGIASTIHMPIGTSYCCGVVEILPSIADAGTAGSIASENGGVHVPVISGRGYGHLARKLGHVYERLDLPATATILPTGLISPSGSNQPVEGHSLSSSQYGSDVPIDRLLDTVSGVIKRIVDGGDASCLLPEVHKTPYF